MKPLVRILISDCDIRCKVRIEDSEHPDNRIEWISHKPFKDVKKFIETLQEWVNKQEPKLPRREQYNED